jgi:hypothetical protein
MEDAAVLRHATPRHDDGGREPTKKRGGGGEMRTLACKPLHFLPHMFAYRTLVRAQRHRQTVLAQNLLQLRISMVSIGLASFVSQGTTLLVGQILRELD